MINVITPVCVIVLLCIVKNVNCQYDDVRCKCVCPAVHLPHKHEYTGNDSQHSLPKKLSRKVFVHSFREPSRCKCKNVVDTEVLLAKHNICEQCECQWQRRNTKTIQVTVIFILVVLGILVVYMCFLICLDPLIASRKSVNYQPQVDNQTGELLDQHEIYNYALLENQFDSQDEMPTSVNGHQRVLSIDENSQVHGQGDASKLMSRVKNRVYKVKDEQNRWKGQVKQQRKHIYDNHTMLN